MELPKPVLEGCRESGGYYKNKFNMASDDGQSTHVPPLHQIQPLVFFWYMRGSCLYNCTGNAHSKQLEYHELVFLPLEVVILALLAQVVATKAGIMGVKESGVEEVAV
jgi:hypothetical protein